jgi:3-isopropylmalate/(R)-2-methylmalate dehydratase small subunit
MQPFVRLSGVAAPLLRANIDTDVIIPSREMKGVSKTGLADGLFAGWRYMLAQDRTPNPDFVLNDPDYRHATILLGGENFGCGSSREHAVWALAEYGFRAIVAPSFSPIFQNNCTRNGLLAVCAPAGAIAALATAVAPRPQDLLVTIDLPAQTIVSPDLSNTQFKIGDEAKEMLLHGLDAIDLTLKSAGEIQVFRDADKAHRPWAYVSG